METLSYMIMIESSLQKVWNVLWGDETYGQWTQYFNPGSQVKSDWKIGGKTYFLNAEGNGLVSTIGSLQQPHYVVFKHLGVLKDGVEDTQSREVKEWSGSFERYFLTEFGGKTKLYIEVQAEKHRREAMDAGFTKGLETVKQLAEKS